MKNDVPMPCQRGIHSRRAVPRFKAPGCPLRVFSHYLVNYGLKLDGNLTKVALKLLILASKLLVPLLLALVVARQLSTVYMYQ